MQELLTHLQIINSVLCAILALHLVFTGSRRPIPARTLAMAYFLYAIQALLLVFIAHGHFATLVPIRASLAMTLGPVFYLYSRTIYRPGSKLYWRDLFHFIPLLFVVSLIVSASSLRLYLDWYIMASFVSYLALVVSALRRGSLSHLGEYALPAFRWLQVMVLLASINLGLELGIYFEIEAGVNLQSSRTLLLGSCLFMLVNGITVFLALRRNSMVEWMLEIGEIVIGKASASSISEQDSVILFEKWQSYVESERIYLKEFGVSLSESARNLSVPARHLSNAINKNYGASYSQYLNDKRVAEIKRLIRENPDQAINDLMFMAGFNTKSNFNKEFLRVSGCSPSEYRKKMLS